MDLFSTLQLLHEAVMSVLITTIYGRWRGTITVPIGNSWDVKLGVICFCWPFSHLCFLFVISGSTSYFQHCSCAPVHSWLLCTVFLYYPIEVWCTLIYHCCWFPCSILPVLYPNWYLGLFQGKFFQACSLTFWWAPGKFDAFLGYQVHWEVEVGSFPWVCIVSSILRVRQCYLIVVWPGNQIDLKSMVSLLFPSMLSYPIHNRVMRCVTLTSWTNRFKLPSKIIERNCH